MNDRKDVRIFTNKLNSTGLRVLRHAGILCILALAPVSVVSCGGNVIAGYAPKNEQEKAELDLEAGRYSEAVERLAVLLSHEPTNYNARSLLASAYAAQAGITALGLIKSVSSTSQGGNSIQRFNALLPEASPTHLNLMAKACENMALIPTDGRSTDIKIQYSLFFSAYAFLQIKYFTTQTEALAALSAEDASKLIQTLAQASEAGGSSPLSQAASSFSTSINSASGDSVTKIKSVLAASPP